MDARHETGPAPGPTSIGGGEILAVGMLLPGAILAAGTRIVVVVRALVELAQRL